MGRQDTLRNLLIAGAVFLLIYTIGEKYLIPPPLPQQPSTTSDAAASDENLAQTESGPAENPAKPDAAPTMTAPPLSMGWRVVEAEAEQSVWIGAGENEGVDRKAPEPEYRMRLKASNVGASIETATLTDHAQRLRDSARYELLSTVGDEARGWSRSFAVEKININGQADLSLADKRWHMKESSADGQTIEFWIDVVSDAGPVLQLRRSFHLEKQDVRSGRHDLDSVLSVINLSGAPQRIVVTYRGGLGIRQEHPQHEDRVIDYGLRASDGSVAGTRTQSAAIHKATKLTLFSPGAGDPSARLSWAATANTYFTCTVAPLARVGSDPADYLAEVAAVDLDANPATLDDITLRFVSRAEKVEPGQALNYPCEFFIGEKDGVAFRTQPDYLARNYYYQIAISFGSCTFAFLVEFMIWLLNNVFRAIPNFGVAIIILVLIVRTLLHPITKKGQINMVRMQKQMGDLAPKLEDIKRRFSNDKARLQQETMKLYREGGINPAGQFLTCLPMMLQMPIWVALWLSLSNNIQMRHEPFISWIRDLTAPDALYTFASPLHIPLYGAVTSFNLLPFLLGITMYLQQKFQPKPKPNPNMTQQQRDQQEMMQKMMPIMSIMMFVLFYAAPSGLTLYITASSIFGTIEQWLIRRHIRAHEEAGTLLKPVVRRVTDEKPKSAFAAWVERLQKKAEDAQRLQRTQRAKPRR